MGCGGSVHAEPPPNHDEEPAKQPKSLSGYGDAQSDANDTDFQIAVGTERRQRSKSELRLVELSKRRSMQGMTPATSSRGLLNVDGMGQSSGNKTSLRRSMAGRRVSMVKSFESSVKHLLDGDDVITDDMDEETKLHLVFEKFSNTEENGSKLVRLADLRDGFMKMDIRKSVREIDMMFGLCDADNSGLLDWQEFKGFFRNLTQDLKACDDDNGNGAMLRKIAMERTDGQLPPRGRVYEYGKRPLRGYKVQFVDGLSSGVRSICCSKNRPILAVADFESSIINIYDMQSGTPRLARMIHGQSDGAIAMSQDKKAFAVSGRETTLVITDMTVGCVMQELEHVGAVTCCAFPAGGKTVLTACQDNAIRYFQVSKGKLLRKSEKLPNSKTGVIVSLNCHRVEAGSTIAVSRTHEHYVRIISASSFNQLHTLRGHRTTVWGCQYSYDGTQLMSHCDKLIKIWNPVSKESLCSIDIRDVINDVPDPDSCVWTTAGYLSEAYSHIVVGVSTDLILFINIMDRSVVLTLPTKYPVCSIDSTHMTNSICCGDEQGNVFMIEVW